MPTFVDLANLGNQGFVIQGDNASDYFGGSVAAAGDVNGDGYGDIIVGAALGDDGGGAAGEAYVIFGKAGGFGPIDVTTLAPDAGFLIQGDAVGDQAGCAVSSAGDINNDGLDDLIVGAYQGDDGGGGAGEAYVIFGTESGFGAVDGAGRMVLDLTTLSPTAGFVLEGATGADLAGIDVATAGDINNDGFDDILIGAVESDLAGSNSGTVSVLFGSASGFGTVDASGRARIDLGALAPDQGFDILGAAEGDSTGTNVAAAGDVNNDGYADFLISAHYADANGSSSGSAYLIYGGAGLGSDLHMVVPQNRIRFFGAAASDQAGFGLSGAGDFNADGYDDLLIGAHGSDVSATDSGISYLVFGRATPFYQDVALADLTAATGITIRGAYTADQSGISVAGAGDVNGDGYDDVIIGATGADTAGVNSGASYLVYGRADGIGTIDLDNLSATDGFVIIGDATGDNSGRSVAGAGDINADGFADLIVGAPQGDNGGTDAGEAYVIFGGPPTVSVTRIGTAIGQTIHGGIGDDLLDGRDGDDTLLGGDGDDRLIGGVGADTLNGGDADDHLTGGSGHDTLIGSDGDDRLAGESGNDALAGGEGFDTLTGGSGNDVLDGGAGGDVMHGGSGNDTYYVSSSGDRITEDEDAGIDLVYAAITLSIAGQHVENVTLQGAANAAVTGNSLDNVFTGNSGANALRGMEGDDTLNGGAGADALTGGLGDDRYIVDNAGDTVAEKDGEGTDTVEASVSFNLTGQFVEILKLTGAGAINGTGNGLNNTITGNAGVNVLSGLTGNDTLNGGGGADTMAGGAGDDLMIVDNAGDKAIEINGEGNDTVEASVTFSLAGQYIETLRLTGNAAINGTGNGQNNVMIGNASANVLDASAGVDSLYGGLGADTLLGGAGQDGFYFDTALGGGNMDTIGDFSVVDDTIWLDRSVFAGITADGALAAGAFRTGTAALDADDRILHDAATGNIWYDADGLGGSAAVLFAKVAAGLALTAADFAAIP